MQIIVTFKGKSGDKYHWERVNDSIPKQLYTMICPSFEMLYPKKNQQYIIYYQRINGSELIGHLSIIDYYITCSYWKVIGDDFKFKKGINKGFLVSEYTSCFPNNSDERTKFIKTLTGIFNKTYNPFTRNNVLRIFERWVDYCEVFGDGENTVFLNGGYKDWDIKTITRSKYGMVKRRLLYLESKTVNPLTKRNCKKWVEFLDGKFG